MSEGATWQDEILRQKERLAADLPSRQIGVACTCILFGFILPFWVVFLIYLLSVGTEVVQIRLLDNFTDRPTRRLQAAILANSALGLFIFSIPALLLWQFPDPMIKFTAVLALIGALLNVSIVRSTHRALGLVSGLPPALALLWMPVWEFMSTSNTANALLATGGVVALLGYFLSSLLHNYRTQTELVSALAEANSASRAKSRFLSAMSHEIRTPLNVILGFSQVLQDAPETLAVTRQITNVEKAARSLSMMIEDVLDLASVAEGDIVFDPVTAVFRQELETAFSQIRTDGLTGTPEVTIKISPEVPELGRFDPLLLRKCLTHLFACIREAVSVEENAALYFDCELTPEKPNWLRLTIGSRHQDANAANDRLNPSAKLEDESLALTLANKIAEVMGADLAFREMPSSGLVARLDLPFVPVPDPPETGVELIYGRLRALVVDDISTNRFVVGKLLQTLRVDFAEADSGTEALEWLRAEPFDLVLLDMNMPDIDGIETFHAIRSSDAKWAKTPVIALTAGALSRQRSHYVELGLNGYVAKPVDKRLLWAEILNVLPPPPPL